MGKSRNTSVCNYEAWMKYVATRYNKILLSCFSQIVRVHNMVYCDVCVHFQLVSLKSIGWYENFFQPLRNALRGPRSNLVKMPIGDIQMMWSGPYQIKPERSVSLVVVISYCNTETPPAKRRSSLLVCQVSCCQHKWKWPPF